MDCRRSMPYAFGQLSERPLTSTSFENSLDLFLRLVFINWTTSLIAKVLLKDRKYHFHAPRVGRVAN